MDDSVIIGKVLESMRLRIKLTQQSAANQAGFRSAGTIAHYEAGERQVTVVTLLRLLDVYQVSLDTFVQEINTLRRKTPGEYNGLSTMSSMLEDVPQG